MEREKAGWKRPASQIAWGYFLKGVNFQAYYLQYILPIAGLLLLFTGTRRLAKANDAFKSAHRLMLAVMAKRVLDLAVESSPAGNLTEVYISFAFVSGILEIAMLLQLRRGFKQAYSQAGLEQKGDPFMALAVYVGLVFIAALLMAEVMANTLVALTLLAAYIYLLTRITGLGSALDSAEYTLGEHPSTKLPNRAAYAAYTALCLAVVFACSFHTSHKRLVPEYYALPAATDSRQALIMLGFPEDILNDLTDKDIAPMEGAFRVECNYHAMNLNRDTYDVVVTEQQLLENDLPDKNSLRAATIYVEKPAGEVYVVHHFLLNGSAFWLDGFNIFGGESEDRQLLGGRLLYDVDSQRYAAGYPLLEKDVVATSDFFMETSQTPSIVGGVNYPMGAENKRGYVIYRDIMPEYRLITSGFDYYHCRIPLNLPYRPLAQRIGMEGIPKQYIFSQHYTVYPNNEL